MKETDKYKDQTEIQQEMNIIVATTKRVVVG